MTSHPTTNKPSYLRRSGDLPDDSGNSSGGAPAWIAMARDKERQREEKMQGEEMFTKENTNSLTDDEVQAEVGISLPFMNDSLAWRDIAIIAIQG